MCKGKCNTPEKLSSKRSGLSSEAPLLQCVNPFAAIRISDVGKGFSTCLSDAAKLPA